MGRSWCRSTPPSCRPSLAMPVGRWDLPGAVGRRCPHRAHCPSIAHGKVALCPMTLRRPVTTCERPTRRTTSRLHSSGVGLAAANCERPRELRMGRYKDVVMSLAKPSEGRRSYELKASSARSVSNFQDHSAQWSPQDGHEIRYSRGPSQCCQALAGRSWAWLPAPGHGAFPAGHREREREREKAVMDQGLGRPQL